MCEQVSSTRFLGIGRRGTGEGQGGTGRDIRVDRCCGNSILTCVRWGGLLVKRTEHRLLRRTTLFFWAFFPFLLQRISLLVRNICFPQFKRQNKKMASPRTVNLDFVCERHNKIHLRSSLSNNSEMHLTKRTIGICGTHRWRHTFIYFVIFCTSLRKSENAFSFDKKSLLWMVRSRIKSKKKKQDLEFCRRRPDKPGRRCLPRPLSSAPFSNFVPWRAIHEEEKKEVPPGQTRINPF